MVRKRSSRLNDQTILIFDDWVNLNKHMIVYIIRDIFIIRLFYDKLDINEFINNLKIDQFKGIFAEKSLRSTNNLSMFLNSIIFTSYPRKWSLFSVISDFLYCIEECLFSKLEALKEEMNLYGVSREDLISDINVFKKLYIDTKNILEQRLISSGDFKNNRLKSPQSLNNVDNVNYL